MSTNDDQEEASAQDAEPKPSPDGVKRQFGSPYIEEAFAKVPGIGQGHRWYDYPYRALARLQGSWLRRMLPRPWLSGLNYLINCLLPFNDHERKKVWSRDDPSHNLFVSADEHVTLPALWVVELFPPSEFASLSRAISRNSWDKKRVSFGSGEDNLLMLERSRGEGGWTWWRLAEIASLDSEFYSPDGVREELPKVFESIELKALQIGTGLTAVVARFMLTATAAQGLDHVWHERHEPRLSMKRRRPHSEDRLWAGFRITQEARRNLHDQARAWLKSHCPGFFASNGADQTLIDLMLLQKFDPMSGLRAKRELSNSLRALGLEGGSFQQRISPSLPGFLLSPNDPAFCPTLGYRSAALWGNLNVIAGGQNNLQTYGGRPDRSIAHAIGEASDTFMVSMAISDLLTDMEKRYATLRDTARMRHGTFQAKDIRELRAAFLTLSLDLATLSRDVASFWNAPWRSEDDVQFILKYADPIIEEDGATGGKLPGPRSLNDLMRDHQKERFQRLSELDSEYRDILSTVASLGASVDSFKVSRLAIWVAAGSLVIAVITLLLANIGPESVLTKTINWIQQTFFD